jgi:hypothetical protein
MIVHLPGEQNVWANLLSRWGTSESVICVMKLVQFRPSPQLDQRFLWPRKEELLKFQLASGEKFHQYDEEDLGLTDTGKWWVPLRGTEDFHQRICVVAHAGAAGHGGIQTTQEGVLVAQDGGRSS